MAWAPTTANRDHKGQRKDKTVSARVKLIDCRLGGVHYVQATLAPKSQKMAFPIEDIQNTSKLTAKRSENRLAKWARRNRGLRAVQPSCRRTSHQNSNNYFVWQFNTTQHEGSCAEAEHIKPKSAQNQQPEDERRGRQAISTEMSMRWLAYPQSRAIRQQKSS